MVLLGLQYLREHRSAVLISEHTTLISSTSLLHTVRPSSPLLLFPTNPRSCQPIPRSKHQLRQRRILLHRLLQLPRHRIFFPPPPLIHNTMLIPPPGLRRQARQRLFPKRRSGRTNRLLLRLRHRMGVSNLYRATFVRRRYYSLEGHQHDLPQRLRRLYRRLQRPRRQLVPKHHRQVCFRPALERADACDLCEDVSG